MLVIWLVMVPFVDMENARKQQFWDKDDTFILGLWGLGAHRKYPVGAG